MSDMINIIKVYDENQYLKQIINNEIDYYHIVLQIITDIIGYKKGIG